MGGYITPEVTGKLPGYLSPSAGLKFADVPNGLAAISKVPALGWAQIAAYFGFVEFSGGFEDYRSGTPGDYGFKVLTSSDPAEKTKKLSAEIANGRFAKMVSRDRHGVTGACTLHLHFVLSRMNLECRLRLVSGTQWVSQQMAVWRTSTAGERQ